MNDVSNRAAARYEAAASILGLRVAGLSADISREEKAAAPNQERRNELKQKRERLTDEQEALKPSDADRIAQLLAEGVDQ